MNPKHLLTIRLAVPDDAQRLADLRWRLQTDDAEVSDPETKKLFVSEFVHSFPGDSNDGCFSHWVAEVDGQVVSVMSVGKVRKVPSPKSRNRHWGYLTNCYTLPEFRNGGIGTQLMSAVKDWAATEEYEFLAVWPSDRSYPFYERSGFERYPDPLILKIDDED